MIVEFIDLFIKKKNAGLHRRAKTVGLVGCRAVVLLWCVVCELPSLPGKPGTGELWVSTGTDPYDVSTQAGWWRHQRQLLRARLRSRVALRT